MQRSDADIQARLDRAERRYMPHKAVQHIDERPRRQYTTYRNGRPHKARKQPSPWGDVVFWLVVTALVVLGGMAGGITGM